ncbi:TonB-dependent receptor [Prolixibacteraceae bacterium JC049]|nr:TonB-dependent receptor [Prolixibacteraceae bacterium JC049]
MKYILLLFTTFLSVQLFAQSTVAGKVTDKKGVPIIGANIYIEGTYDGASTDAEGNFRFKTDAKGMQTLIASFIGYNELKISMNVFQMKEVHLELKESIHSVDAVTVTAGTFSTNNNGKMSALKPLDVVTTAGSFGDYLGAFQSMPGTSAVPEDGRLFIRGGDGYESQTFIDGMRVFKPYTATAAGVPSRGRNSPMLFKGMTFSSGGYSAEYGQALSGVLLLDTEDEPLETETNISLMSIGGSLGHTWKGENKAFTITGSYMNLAPYYGLVTSRYDWKKSPESFSGESSYRHQLKNGMLKAYVAYDFSKFRVLQDNIKYARKVDYKTNDVDLYSNISYKGSWGEKWITSAGISFSDNKNENRIWEKQFDTREKGAHFKLKAKYLKSDNIRFSFGAEQFLEKGTIDLSGEQQNRKYHFEKGLSAAFAEANIFFSKNSAITLGSRGEYSSLTKEFTYSPRISLAQKLGKNGQLSLAAGRFYQMAQNKYDYYSRDLQDEYSNQLIANYSWKTKHRMLRVELYHKKYKQLIKEESDFFNNNGSGYAKGLDLFWRDNKTFKYLQYWVSYSLLDTKRNQGRYPYAVRPNYVNKHNLSVVGKYWIPALRSQLGVTYKLASGRPYNDPNEMDYMNRKTDAYHCVNMNWSWLISQQTILYLAASNVLGTSNVYGYRYANEVNNQGVYSREAIRGHSKRFLFVGLFITISGNRNKNQLNNL